MSSNSKIKLFILTTLSFGVICSCQAPRNNPLDPENPNHTLAAIQGKVQTVSFPRQPIAETAMFWKLDNQLVYSDQNGYYQFDDVRDQDGWLKFDKAGYHSDSSWVNWMGSKNVDVTVYLNKLPVLDSLVFFSSIQNRYPNIKIVELQIRAKIEDPDNDIDSVFIISPALNFKTHLEYNTVDKFYERLHISMGNLGITHPEEVVGKEFNLLVKDSFGRQIDVLNTLIKRLINEEVELKSPIGQDTVSTQPTLSWLPVNPGYDFKYAVEIRADVSDPPLVWWKENLPASSFFVEVDKTLSKEPLNRYIWAVWIIDNFGNRARTKYSKFIVD